MIRKVFMAVAVAAFLAIWVPSQAQDVVLDVKVTKSDELIDRNGRPYVRFIVEETRELQGIKYIAEVPVMAFGSQASPAKEVKGTLKAIADKREYQGRTSYTVLKFITK